MLDFGLQDPLAVEFGEFTQDITREACTPKCYRIIRCRTTGWLGAGTRLDDPVGPVRAISNVDQSGGLLAVISSRCCGLAVKLQQTTQ
jgi:hypothetical protein